MKFSDLPIGAFFRHYETYNIFQKITSVGYMNSYTCEQYPVAFDFEVSYWQTQEDTFCNSGFF